MAKKETKAASPAIVDSVESLAARIAEVKAAQKEFATF